MPTYHYKCTKCSHEFEEFQNISDPPLEDCPKCGGSIKRVISGGAGLLFRGDGFYITDYRSEGYKKEAQKDKPKTEKSKSDSSSKSETKPKKSSDS